MKKRVVIDARMIGAQGHGIGNYVLDLARELSRRQLAFEVFYLLSPECPADSILRSLPHRISAVPFLHPLEAFRLGAEIEGDLFHSPSFVSLAKYPCPYIQTVHDLNHLTYGGKFHKLYYRFLLLPSLRNARAVLSVSDSAALEISAWLKKYGVEKKITVATNAIAEPAKPDFSLLKRLQLKPGQYFFCLSNAKPHKNLDMLVDAHARVHESLPLILNTQLGRLSSAEISGLLAGARAFFFPSLYEGFGRPPLEAALLGTKPVVSRIAPHVEVLKGVKESEFLDPRKPAEWAEAFVRLSKEAKQEVSAESREWVRRTYSEKRLGDTMEKIYAENLI